MNKTGEAAVKGQAPTTTRRRPSSSAKSTRTRRGEKKTPALLISIKLPRNRSGSKDWEYVLVPGK